MASAPPPPALGGSRSSAAGDRDGGVDDLAIDFRRLRAEMREKRRRERRAAAVLAGEAEKKEIEAEKSASLWAAAAWEPKKGPGGSLRVTTPGGECSCAIPPPPESLALLDPSVHAVRPEVLRTVCYVPSFLPVDWSDAALRYLQSLPEHPGGGGRSEHDHLGMWTRLRHARRRVALFDSSLDPVSSDQLPGPLGAIAEMLVRSGAFPPEEMGGPPNHVLVNAYNPGEGIMAHTDGPAYEDRTCTISVGGGDAILKFSPRRNVGAGEGHVGRRNEAAGDGTVLEVLLRGNGSLVVFTGKAYISYCHSIDEVEEETTSDKCGNAGQGVAVQRGYRVSLTFRRKK